MLDRCLPHPSPNPADLLAWYDRNRRVLPWRARPGETADPYRVWLSEIMLQQTTVAAAGPYFARFLARFPDVHALARAPIEDVLSLWAGLGYYARARNLHACAILVSGEYGGGFPDSEAGLRALPGIGPYTAAAVAAIAFDRRAAAVDGNVERVVSRLYALEEEIPRARPAIRARAEVLVPDARAGDFAQAMMDLGATICTPRRPACTLCPWMASCKARAAGIPETFPRKAAKPERPQRLGAAFIARRADGAVLLGRRPPKGLLGGMAEVPGTQWAAEMPDNALRHAPLEADWRRSNSGVRHVFTHFALDLAIYRADLALATIAPDGLWWSAPDRLDTEALPSVMRKAIAVGLG